jgi:acyl-CoA dehydrogenase
MNVQSIHVQDVRATRDSKTAAEATPVTLTKTAAADLNARAEAVAATAAANATAVDREARFPHEAIAVARSLRLLGIMVPHEFGGEGASVSDVVDVCYMLGRSCAATAMVYAMHQTKVACLVRHGRGSAWHERLLRPLCVEQLLLASSTTEGQSGGDVRKSAAAVERQGGRISLERAATVISYGEHADGIVTTARRSSEAAATDQVLVRVPAPGLFARPHRRGTLRHARHLQRRLRAQGRRRAGPDLRSPEKIHRRPWSVAHLAWSGAWTGIAAGAVEALAAVRAQCRRVGGAPAGAAH